MTLRATIPKPPPIGGGAIAPKGCADAHLVYLGHRPYPVPVGLTGIIRMRRGDCDYSLPRTVNAMNLARPEPLHLEPWAGFDVITPQRKHPNDKPTAHPGAGGKVCLWPTLKSARRSPSHTPPPNKSIPGAGAKSHYFRMRNKCINCMYWVVLFGQFGILIPS